MKRTCSFVTVCKPNAVLDVISIPESRTLFEVIEHLRSHDVRPDAIFPYVQPAIYEMPGLANATYITTYETYHLRKGDITFQVTFRCNLEDGDTFFMIELNSGARILTSTLTKLLDYAKAHLFFENHIALDYNPKTGEQEYYLVSGRGKHGYTKRIMQHTYQEVK